MKRELKAGEVEIVWGNGRIQHIQTTGLQAAATALILDVDGSKMIIPYTSVRHFRVKAI